MDIFDELELAPVRDRTFAKVIDINEDEDVSDNESDNREDGEDYGATQAISTSFTSSLLGITLDSKVLQPKDTNARVPDFSVLDKIKRRLNGEESVNEETVESVVSVDVKDINASTQVVSLTQSEEIPMSTQVISQTQIINNFIEEIPEAIHKQVPSISQEEEEEEEEANLSLEKHSRTALNSLFISDSDEEITTPLTESERKAHRAKQLEELASKKRQERLEQEKAKAKENNELEADITRVSLTDEEIEEYETSRVESTTAARGGISSKKRDEEMAKVTARLAREAIQGPELAFAREFGKKDFLKDFLESSPTRESDFQTNKSTPQTSPISTIDVLSSITSPTKKSTMASIEFSSSSDEGESNRAQGLEALQLLKSERPDLKKVASPKFNSPISNYQRKLKDSFLHDIELDSDDESEMKTTASRVSILEMKARLKKKNIKKVVELAKTNPSTYRKKVFLQSLKAATRQQYISMKKELMGGVGEIEEHKDEETDKVMESLLEREINRAKKIREAEKRASKKASKSDDSDYEESEIAHEIPDSDVPDSAYEDSEGELEEGGDSVHNSDSEADDESSEDEEAETNDGVLKRKPRQIKTIISDDEDVEGAVDSLKVAEKSTMNSAFENVGSNAQEDDDGNFGFNLGSYGGETMTQKMQNMGINLDDAFKDTQPSNSNETKSQKIEKLRKLDSVIGESSFDQTLDGNNDHEEILMKQLSKPKDVFEMVEIMETQESQIQVSSFSQISQIDLFSKPTQTDTQEDEATQTDKTQVDGGFTQMPIIDEAVEKVNEDIDDDDEEPPIDNRRKRLVHKTSVSDSDEEESEEAMNMRLKIFKEKQRRQELKERKRRSEFERRGLNKIVEGEADESEDEWQGLGGRDGEESDQANSEDEKMIDDRFNLILNDQDIKEKFMRENKIEDEASLEKLLDDIKNHRLIKRRHLLNDYDLDSDDEETTMMIQNYNKFKAQRQRERLLQNKQLQDLEKDKKKQAFFDTIANDNTRVQIDHCEVDDEFARSDEDTPEKEEVNPFLEEQQPGNSEDVITTKKVKVSNEFVQKSLSFLYDIGKDDREVFKQKKLAKYQHGFELSSDEEEDIHTLKQKSIIKLQSQRDGNSKKRSIELDDSDDEELSHMFKKPSVTKSFQRYTESNSSLVKDGTASFSGVTVSKTFKVASGNKAAITSMFGSKRTLKVKKIEDKLRDSRLSRRDQIFNSGTFDS